MHSWRLRAISIWAALLCAALITACQSNDGTGTTTQYVTYTSGDPCPTAGAMNYCSGTMLPCPLVMQTCDPTNHWTACAVQPGCDAGVTFACTASTNIFPCTQVGGAAGEYCCNVAAGTYDLSACHPSGYCFALSIDASIDGPMDASADAAPDVADACVTGAACYTGPAGTSGVGTCHGGTFDCATSTCTGQVTPVAEICGNGLDDDCNGVVDNGCGCMATGACTSGISPDGCHCDFVCQGFGNCCTNACSSCPANFSVGACYTGPAGTQGVGVCVGGTNSCTGTGGSTGCVGQVLPSAEVCNGLDDNCDGTVDNGIAPVACYTGPAGTQGVGVCVGGTQTCSGGTLGACTGQVLPSAEVCNGLDDNCNGLVDDGLSPIPCYTGPAGTNGVGACHGGTQGCVGGMLGTCAGQVLPSVEICNGIDDDCNGLVDDGIAPIACYTGPAGTQGVGVCVGGTQTCSGGTFGACTGQVLPSAEVCNGLDDNCNGTVDEGLALATCGVGACARTGTTCAAASCTPGTPTAEICNGIDDDCNGLVDDGIAPIACYTGPAGTQGVGTCHGGTQTCSGGTFGACTGQVTPVAEICGNGLDDDCNGVVDNGCPMDAGVDSGVDAGVDATVDSGTDAGTDSGTDASADTGADASCGNLTVTLSAATEAACTSGGYTGIIWDNAGVSIAGPAGGPVTACIQPTGTFVISTAVCGTVGWNERDWTPYAGMTAAAAGVSSIMFRGVEMSGIARICRDTYSTGAWRIVIPNNATAQSSLATGCPYPLF